MKKKKEIEVVTLMIELYCHKKHKTKKHKLCKECNELLDYVKLRRDKCPWPEGKKPFCQNCRIHCYQEPYKEKIREVMRFSGPRMALYHPIIAFSHLSQTKKEKRRLKKIEQIKEEKAKINV